MFGCNEGYSPSGTMTAVCVATDTWSPDPAQLECTNSTTTTSGNGTEWLTYLSHLVYSCIIRVLFT